ncbi:MAG: sugar phosphate isomerase/epimerase, partial [Flavobacteriaceae bacterium]|nr:sugar phosphate isomerase/epimerase [Flavobacteriaceae bacterium]
PDFGNFCMADEGYGSVFDGTCKTAYDFYKGVEEMMPKAFAVSAKSNDFDENGNEKTIDYMKMLKIVNSFGYKGYIGVEYEGERLSEVEGIKATRDLLIKVGQSI